VDLRAEDVVLSDEDRRVLEEIERHLQGDPGLRGTFSRPAVRAVPWARRTWWTVLVVSLTLMLGMAAMDVVGAALESAALVVVAGVALRCTRSSAGDRTARGRARDRRP